MAETVPSPSDDARLAQVREDVERLAALSAALVAAVRDRQEDGGDGIEADEWGEGD